MQTETAYEQTTSQMTATPVMVSFEDICKIGNTISPNGEYTEFICNGDTYNIELILLRSILSIRGYKILSVDDFAWPHTDELDIIIRTDLPAEEFWSVSRSEE